MSAFAPRPQASNSKPTGRWRSISAAAVALGLHRQTVRRHRELGLKLRPKKDKMTQAAAGAALGVAQGTICNWAASGRVDLRNRCVIFEGQRSPIGSPESLAAAKAWKSRA